jgi:hypothetical protein
LFEVIMLAEASLMRTRHLRPRSATVGAVVLLSITVGGISFGRAEDAASTMQAPQTWTCRYIAATPDGPLQITAKFQVVGDELAEVETIPSGLNFSEKYKILENNDTDIVAAISIARIGGIPPPGIGAVVIIIAKQNGLFQQSGAVLGLRTGPPTLGHCDVQ